MQTHTEPPASCRWTSRRIRHLVRLWTLTLLTKDGIAKVLKSDDFKTSETDIRTKLKEVLPLDYSPITFRQFRPRKMKDDANMVQRYILVIGLKKCHLPKYPGLNYQLVKTASFRHVSNTSKPLPEPVSAFKSYPIASSGTISPLAVTNPNFSCYQEQPYEAHPTPEKNLPGHSSVLYDVGYSARLMLDGSLLPPKDPEALHINTTRLNSEDDSYAVVNMTTRFTSRKKPSSLGSLDRRLAGAYSQPQLQHVQKVMCISESTSSRSEFDSRSVTSNHHDRKRTTLESCEESHHEDLWAGRDPASVLRDDFALSLSAIDTHAIQGILPSRSCACDFHTSLGNDLFPLLGERPGLNTAHWIPKFLSQFNAHPRLRSCCKLFERCSVCGAFASVESPDLTSGTLTQGLNSVDFYGNTQLHFVWLMDMSSFLLPSRLDLGHTIFSARNSSGETFLHTMCRGNTIHPFTCPHYDPQKFYKLLEELALVGFNFTRADFHGRTFLHTLLNNREEQYLTSLAGHYFLKKVVTITGMDPKIQDNIGSSIDACFRKEEQQMALLTSAMQWPTLCANDHFTTTPRTNKAKDYRTTLAALRNEDIIREWVPSFEQKAGTFLEIDNNGDTPLAAITKSWKGDDSGIPLQDTVVRIHTTEPDVIHMRDRGGHTLLAIAVQRGLRALVTTLLSLKSNIHARDYNDAGILQQASKVLKTAKTEGNDKLYATVWTCQMLMIDNGAKVDPTYEDEWMIPGAREKYLAEISDNPMELCEV